MGLAGGLVPSPTALVVLLGAAAVGRAWFGVLLVVAFGLGMALTLSAVGLAVAHAGHRVARLAPAAQRPRLTWVLRRLPLVTAVVVCVLGLLIVARGLLGALG
jgi:ABC-type nickel/cobalt efflux system permease component RcnA